jgi:peroxiredoxin
LAVVLPLAEVAVAIALLPAATAWWGAVGALTLLLLFSAVIGVNLALGRKPDCRCFGQLHSSPAGWQTLARNGLLAALAGLVVWNSHESSSFIGELGELTSAQVAAGAAGAALLALAMQTWVVFNLARQNGRVLLRLDALERRIDAAGLAPDPGVPVEEPERGLPVGSPAPLFSLSGLHGETLTLESLRIAGKPVVLIFTDPDCGPCNALMPEIGAWQRDYSGDLMFAILSRGTVEANGAKSAEHGLFNVLLQVDREVADAYQAEGTPSAVIVDSDGTIASSVVGGADAMRALLARAAGVSAAEAVPMYVPPAESANGNGAAPAPEVEAPSIGDRVPKATLPDLDGKRMNLARLRGRKTLVLFWDPSCGYCEEMLDELKAWDANPPEDAPRLVVVSTGSVETNRAMGLRSPVLLDEGFRTGTAFGARGTPMAVLIEDGRFASSFAAGGAAVMALARGEEAPAEPVLAPAPSIGDPAPTVELPDLTGRTTELSDFTGAETLVLFWNPGCGFCQRMLDDLKAWEAHPRERAPKLLVVSTGTVEANQAQGLRSPVVLDEGFAVGTAFGAGGTPSAVLVDETGLLASEVAVGASAVLELANAGSAATQTTA